MTRRLTRHWQGTALAILAVTLPAGAGQPPEYLKIRDETQRIWPIKRLQQRGYAVREIPRDENAAWVYLDAVNAYVDLPEDLVAAFGYACDSGWQGLPTSQRNQLTKWLDLPDNRRALALARKASQMEQCQIPYCGDPDGSLLSVLLPPLRHHRMIAKMLVTEGRRQEASGNHQEAWEAYATAYRMGAHLGDGITLIESLVGVACIRMADQAMRELILTTDFTPEQLEQKLEELAALDELRPTTEASFAMEEVFAKGMVDEVATNPFGLLYNLSSIQRGNWDIQIKHPTAGGWDALEVRLGRLLLPDQTAKRHVEKYFEAVQKRADLPAYEARWNDGWDEKIIGQIPKWDIVAAFVLPSLSRASEISERLRAESQMTQVATALRLYMLEHDGAAPDSLAEIQDTLEPDVLVDPFSGDWFVYQRTGDGWLIYSFAENLRDDGGDAEAERDERDFVCRYPVPEPEPFEH